MMNGMPMGQAKEAQDPNQQSEGEASPNVSPKQLVTGIHTQLMALMDMIAKAPGIGDQTKQALSGIISQYQDFVKNDLGSGPSQKAPSAPGSVAPEVAGNPNARPM